MVQDLASVRLGAQTTRMSDVLLSTRSTSYNPRHHALGASTAPGLSAVQDAMRIHDILADSD